MSADVAMEKASAAVTQRRLRLDDSFTAFDRFGTGRLAAAQFARVLTMHKLNLSAEEVDALAVRFAASRGASKSSARPLASPSAAAPAAADGAANFTAPTSTPAEVNYHAFLLALRTYATGRDHVSVVESSASAGGSRLSAVEEQKLRPVAEALRHAISSRRVDVLSPFRSADPLHTGRVTTALFERCLPVFSDIQVASAMVRLFVKKYGDPSGSTVNYLAWCADIDPAGAATTETTGRGATAEAAAASVAADSSTSTRESYLRANGTGLYTNANLSAEELVRVLREQFALYRLRCEDYLLDFDPRHSGVVSAAQFESALGRLRLVRFALSQENITTLVSAYLAASATGVTPEPGVADDSVVQVDYCRFLRDTDPRSAPAESAGPVNYFAASHAPGTFLTDDAERAAAERVVQKVAQLVHTNRVFLSPVMRDFDRMNRSIHEHRTCSSAGFAQGLATQNLLLPADELRLLVKKYAVPAVDGSRSDDVNYYQFVQDVDPSQAPPQPAAAADRTRDATAARAAAPDTVRPATSLDVVLDNIARQAGARGLRVNEFFPDFDALRSGSVAAASFVCALGIAGVQDLASDELHTLVTAFPSAKVPGGVDTTAFMRALGAVLPNYAASPALTLKGGSSYASATATATQLDDPDRLFTIGATALSSEDAERLASVLKRLRHEVKSRGALLLPFFADFDRQGRGKISESNFRQALARHRFVLNESDLELLCRSYREAGATRAQVQSLGVTGVLSVPPMIAYRRFVAAVSDESTVNYLTQPSASAALVAAQNPDRSPANSSYAVRTLTGAAPLAEALEHVCRFAQERRPRLEEFFTDADELHRGLVSRPRFSQALCMLGLTLPAEEQAALEEGFLDGGAVATGTGAGVRTASTLTGSAASATAQQQVNYPLFVRTIHEMLARGVGADAVARRRLGPDAAGSVTAGHNGEPPEEQDADELLCAATLARIKRVLAARRTTALSAFREVDRTRTGRVSHGEFFACVNSAVGVPLAPHESAVLAKAFALPSGELSYVRFTEAVDSKEFA